MVAHVGERLALVKLAGHGQITWHWVKAHIGIEVNENANQLEQQEMTLKN